MAWACVLAVLIVTVLLDAVTAAGGRRDEGSSMEIKIKFALYLGALLAGGVALDTPTKSRGPAPPHRPRKRRGVKSIFNEYGEYYCGRAYRMDTPSFWKLHSLLEGKMTDSTKKGNANSERVPRMALSVHP